MLSIIKSFRSRMYRISLYGDKKAKAMQGVDLHSFLYLNPLINSNFHKNNPMQCKYSNNSQKVMFKSYVFPIKI